MIVRAWRERAGSAENANAYVRHLREGVFPQLSEISGHLGAQLLRRDLDGQIEFLVLTTWESMHAVRGSPATSQSAPSSRRRLAPTWRT